MSEIDPKVVERVARAICCSSWNGKAGASHYLQCDCVAWRDWLETAKVAIQELQRDPVPVVRFEK